MSRIHLLLAFSLWLKVSLLSGQVPFFQKYHPLKKNHAVQASKLLQDSKGFIWIGTDRALFRFDGNNYKQYTKKNGLSDDRITALAEDSLGRIWVGHENGMISRVEEGQVYKFEPDEGSAIKPISDIHFDRNGVMWFSTENDGLYYYMNDRLFRADEQEGLPDLFIYDLFEDGDGNIWAGTDAGIALCAIRDKKIQIKVIDSDEKLPDIIIKKIKYLGDQTMGLATEDAGLLSYDPKTGDVKNVVEGAWNFGSISDFVVKENQVWIATVRNGLVVFDTMTKDIKTIPHADGVNLQAVVGLLLDAEGNIWSASKSGLARTSGDAVEHLDVAESREGNNVLAVTVGLDRKIWFSTSEGLFVKDEKHSAGGKKLVNTGSGNAPVICLYTDVKGFVWAGLYGDGLVRINPETFEIIRFQKELRNGNVLGITGKGNTVWIATLGGATSLTFEDNQFAVRNYTSADGLSSDFIYQVYIDSSDRTWFATDGKGVSMLDKTGFHHYDAGLGSKVVYSFAEDNNKDIWVTAQDNGLYKFDGTGFTTMPGIRLRDNAVQSLAADKFGNVIATHSYGVDVFNVKSKQMKYWGEEAGIRDKNPNLNAITRDHHGQFFIGTSAGIVKFSLNNDHTLALPRIDIDDIRVFGDVVTPSKASRLYYNENNITIHYLGFWYQNAGNLTYLYKLENYDVEWINTRNQEVTYSKLPPGDYTFKVKVSDTDDFTNAAETFITFSIQPPLWRTATFYVCMCIAVVICGYGFIQFRERRLRQEKVLLEAMVEERTKEIQQKTEEIQAQNEEIMAQAEEIQGINENLEMLVKQRTVELEKKNLALEEYAFINAHKLRSPVASILGLVNLLAKSKPMDDTTVIKEHLKESANKLDAVVRSITRAIEKADNRYQ